METSDNQFCENVAHIRRYQKLLSTVADRELMVSGSDDFTLFLWNPSQDKKFIARMTGHQVGGKIPRKMPQIHPKNAYFIITKIIVSTIHCYQIFSNW